MRKELGQHNKDDDLERLQFRYDVLVDSVEASGFNPGIFDAVIPTAAHVQRGATEAGQVKELLQNNKAFSASGQWNSCESRIGNAGVTIQAQKQQLELNENVRLLVVNKKSEAQVKILGNAQTALHKYNADENSLNDKEWGDIVRWVLPEAKIDFLLKDLRRKVQILTKLASLPKDWTTYIPRPIVVDPVPITAA